MSGVLDRLFEPTRAPSKFFKALTAADQHIATFDREEFVATFAPPPIMGGGCSCGSVFEVRRDRIGPLTDDEKTAAAEAVASPGISPGADVAQVVIDAIENVRDRQAHEAIHDWQDRHSLCGDDL